MKSLITGIDGFVGRYMADLLRAEGHEVIGIDKSSGLDILNKTALREFIAKSSPDYIFHFAGQSNVPESIKDPYKTFDINITGTLNLYEAIVAANIKPGVIFAGSGDEYGAVDEKDIPIRESTLLKPINPNAVSKVAGSFLSYQYSQSYGLRIIRVRSFNQEGPGRPEAFALSSFCRQITEIEKGRNQPIIEVGNINVKRDFLDVRDSVRAYLLLAQKGVGGEVYNVCSGVPVTLSDALNYLISKSTVKDIQVTVDESRVRGLETPVKVGDNTKLKELTGWQAEYDLHKTLDDMLQYWREKI